MSYGIAKTHFVTMTSGLTASPTFDLGWAYRDVFLEIPSMASGTDILIKGSSDGTTFRRVMHPPINSAAQETNTFVIGSSVTNRIVPIPNGFRYMQVELTTALTDTVSVFKVICSI